MNLIIDAGNTQIKWAIYSKNEQIFRNSVTTWENFLAEDYISSYPNISSLLISSVRSIPEKVLFELKEKFENCWELSYNLPLPIKIKYKTPETLGKDRIAAAVAGQSLYPDYPVLIIDMGTAITFDIVNEKSEFLGGNISPGMKLRFASLERFTKDLPLISPSHNVPLIGQSTEEAIRAGVQSGILYEVDAYINTLINKYNELRTILTGGDASFFVKNLKNTIFVVPDLVLDGLNLILEHQKKNYQG